MDRNLYMTTGEFAALMGVSVNTVKSYMESIFEKLQISSRNEIDAYVNR